MRTLRLFRAFMIAVATCAVLLGTARSASASGPLERLVQYIAHPTNPSVVVLRFGVASEGLLFSRDGGRSFQALCSNAIDGGVDRLSSGRSPYIAPAVMDANGGMVVASSNAVWADDGTGCRWTKQEAFAGKWVTALSVDPADPRQVLAIANVAFGEGEDLEVRAEVLRRNAAGVWSVEGTLRPPAKGVRSYGGQLFGAMAATGPVLYATVSFASGALATQELAALVVSTDGGKTWDRRADLPVQYPEMSLIGVDPTNPERLLASAPQRNNELLLVSVDGGRSFQKALTVYELSGVTFSPSGQVFVGDAGDSASLERTGGVFTAKALGEPLAPIPQPARANPASDCVGFDARDGALRICRFHRYGTLDTTSGEFSQLTQLEGVKGLLSCEGRDIRAACEEQFNDGLAWCCTGHYPFTSFCGSYDVTVVGDRPVACGMSGRDADLRAGRGPQLTPN